MAKETIAEQEAEIAGIVALSRTRALKVNDSDRDYHTNWGWPMLDIEQWFEPLPMRGRQGLWNWPTPEGLL